MTPTIAALIFIFFALVVAWFRVAISGGSITRQWWPIVIAVFLGWNILVPLVFLSATYHGKVVDQHTGEPIAGAVVAVIWYHSPVIQMDQTKRFQAVQETVTDSDGSFSLWTWPGIDLNPFTYVLTPPYAIIYKAGYAPLARGTTYDRGYSTYESLADALKTGITIKLPKLRTKKEAMNFVDLGSLSVIDVPNHRIPKLVHQVNVHSKTLGISPYPERGT